MSQDLEEFIRSQPCSPDRPFQGLTVLVVEDSRFASEAIRLLCLKSGARIRRADSLAAAHRHLRLYRPSIVIVDMGLPDGSGADLIRELSQNPIRVPALLGTSGDDSAQSAALDAGADLFLPKPVESLAAFQQAILSILPDRAPLSRPRALPSEIIQPDPLAFRDDLSHVATLMRADVDGSARNYMAQFLEGVARSAHDDALETAAHDLAQACAQGRNTQSGLSLVAGLLEERLAQRQAI